jgi:hypothetical protein
MAFSIIHILILLALVALPILGIIVAIKMFGKGKK